MNRHPGQSVTYQQIGESVYHFRYILCRYIDEMLGIVDVTKKIVRVISNNKLSDFYPVPVFFF